MLCPYGNPTLAALLEETSGGVNRWYVSCDQLGSTRQVRYAIAERTARQISSIPGRYAETSLGSYGTYASTEATR